MTDEEVLTIYLFGILSHRRTLKQIHSYAYDHLREWFPKLFCYETLVRRVDEMGEMLPVFLEILLDVQCDPTIRSRFKLIDSGLAYGVGRRITAQILFEFPKRVEPQGLQLSPFRVSPQRHKFPASIQSRTDKGDKAQVILRWPTP